MPIARSDRSKDQQASSLAPASQPQSDTTTGNVRRRAALRVGAGLLLLFVIVGLACLAVRLVHARRTQTLQQALARIGVHVELAQTSAPSLSSLIASGEPSHATYLGNKRSEWSIAALLRGPQIVGARIDNPFATDQDLQLIGKLRELQTLELHSDAATDKTLQAVSRLPKLQHLGISGDQFTAKGLLLLRGAPSLERVELHSPQWSPIELAVLKTEIGAVLLTGSRAATARTRAAILEDVTLAAPLL